MNTSGEAVSWGTDGYAAYIEYYSSDEACGVGYNDGLAVGTTGKMNVGWVDMNDTSKYFRFLPADPKKKDSPFTRNYPFKLNTESIPRVIQPYN